MSLFSSPRRLLAVAGVFAALLLAAMLRFKSEEIRNGRSATDDEPAQSTRQNPTWRPAPSTIKKPAAKATVRTATASYSPVPSTQHTAITAVLLEAGPATSSHQVTAYISAAQINPDDLAEQTDRALRGNTGAGASNVLELANVSTWTTASVTLRADSRHAQITSQKLPAAPLYEIAAYDYQNDRYYTSRNSAAELQSTSSQLEIPPIGATGIRLTLRNATQLGSDIVARVERRVSHEPGESVRAGATLHLTRLFKPRLADIVLNQDPLLLSTTNSTVLAPLPPDPEVGIHLSIATGVETGPLVFQLQPGQIVPAEIDCGLLFHPEDVTGTNLRAQVLLEPNDKPVADANVWRLRGDERVDHLVTDSRGFVNFPGIPLSSPTTFEVETSASQGKRPVAPRTRFSFDPKGSASADSQVSWRLKPYFWIILDMPTGTTFNNEDDRKGAPYDYLVVNHRKLSKPLPIYVLQKFDSNLQQWKDSIIDESVEDDIEFSFSARTPGRYRIGVAPSALELYFTDPVQLGPSSEAHTRFPAFSDPSSIYVFHVFNPDGSRYRGPVSIFHRYAAMRPERHSDASREFNIPIPHEPLLLNFEFPKHAPIEMLVPTVNELTSRTITINL